MALWQKIKQLGSAESGDITALYTFHNIPIEVRDFCSVWIEASIKHLSAEAFVLGLKSQIQEKLQSICDSSYTPFYVIQRLTNFQTSLTTVYALKPGELHARFTMCLESEKQIIRASQDKLGLNVPYAAVSNIVPTPTLETMMETRTEQSIDIATQALKDQARIGGTEMETHTLVPEADDSLNSPTRVIMDSEMSYIFEAVGSIEELNNMFAFKCHELKRLQAMLEQNRMNGTTNGLQNPQLQTYQEFQELQSQMNETKSEVLQMATLIWGKTNEIRHRSVTVVQNWAELKTDYDKDLETWTQKQRISANGKPMNMNINDLQHLSEYLMEVAWKLRHYLLIADKIRQININLFNATSNGQTGPSIADQIVTVTSFITQLVQDTFIIVHQPCQVLKTNTRFHVPPGKSPMEVRLLVGEKLSLKLTPPSVSVSIIDENSCRDIQTNGLHGDRFKKVMKKGRLLPENTRMDFCPEAKCSTAVFRQISLKDFYRNGRKTTLGKEQAECVTEEKLCLLFRSEFSLGDLNFQIWKMSLPLVVITHGSQEGLAWAAVTWDNEFSQQARVPFHVPDHASWSAISAMLNYKFISMVGTPLTEENLKYFANRLADKPGFPHALSWSEMCKVNLPDRKFTFWEWFFEGAKLIEQHLKDAWQNKFVLGFIGKEVSENMLCKSGCTPGTFLFRFSESVLGGISIVWLHSDGKAYSLNPFKSKDLITQPFVEKLDQETLHNVYPNIPKEVAFKKYYDDYKCASKTGESSGLDKRYVHFRNQLVIDDPNIPKFRLNSKSDKAILLPQQTSVRIEKNRSNSEQENLIDLDIDNILNSMYTEDWNPEVFHSVAAQGPARTLSEFSGDREGPRSTAGQDYSHAEESFYMQL